MVIRLLNVCFLAAVASAASCSTDPTFAAASPNECDISTLDSGKYDRETWCIIKEASRRCIKSDKCLTQCERRGGEPMIGGGCQHTCMGWASTPQSIAENGGEAFPPAAADCINGKAP